MLLAPTLLLMGQVVAPLSGTAVDGDGRPLAGLEIVLAGSQAPDGTVPVLDRSTTDSRGRYTISAAAVGRRSTGFFRPSLYAYRTGSGLVGFRTQLRQGDPEQFHLAVRFREAGRRTFTVRDGDGRPLAGVRLAPLVVGLWSPGSPRCLVPDALADRMEASTGPDGRAELACLEPTTEISGLRATVPGLGTHALALPRSEFKSERVTLDLKRIAPMTGRVRQHDGKPAAGARIEIWSLAPYGSVVPVRFEAGAVRTGADGTFRTPSALLAGVRYRALVRAPGFRPSLTPWVTSAAGAAADAVTVLPAVLLTPERDVEGRVIDRQGRPVAGAEVGAAGESASATTDVMGKFRLAGLASSRTLLVVRHDGFRITGRLLDERADDVELVLARFDEPAPRPLTTLEGTIPLEERRRLARRILEPYLVEAPARGGELPRFWALQSLMKFDPKAALEALERTKFDPADPSPSILRYNLARELVRAAPEQAAAVATSVPDARIRALALVDVGVALPDDQRPRKRAVAERVLQMARAEPQAQQKLTLLGDAAELLLDAGADDQARTVFAEGRAVAGRLGAESRQALGHFAARLARVDLTAAVAMLGGFDQAASRAVDFGNLATRIAASNPLEAERVDEAIRGEAQTWPLTLRICAKMAPVDLARARRIALGQPSPILRAMALVFAASGLPAERRESARELVREAVRELDGGRDQSESFRISPAALMPPVEAIDPALVPEFFWRAVAEIGAADDPRVPQGRDDAFREAILLARYDREVASALYEPAAKATILKRTDDARMSAQELTVLALIAPRRAVAAVEAMSDSPEPGRGGAEQSRTTLSALLGNDDEGVWRRVWYEFSYLFQVLDTRDIREIR